MKNIGFLLFVLTVWNSQTAAQTPYFQGKTIRFVVGYPAGSTRGPLGTARRALHDQIYSRQSDHDRAKHARRGLYYRGELRLWCG